MACAGKPHSIREFRLVLPLSVDEYHVGQLWSVAEASKNETGGGDGVEVISNEPFDTVAGIGTPPPEPLIAGGKEYTAGQYTHKIYHVSQKVPGFIRLLAPKGSLDVHEKAWNAYPYCRTIVTNGYMKENFYIIIESFHASDRGKTNNIHDLTGRDLEKRIVVDIDIANDAVGPKDYKPEWDPTKVKSEKANRGPLPKDGNDTWKENVEPVMCCYKLVKVYFKWFGLQNRVEKFIMNQETRLFRNFHRQVVCWLDDYYGMTMEDIRKIEEKAKEELDKQLNDGEVRGMVAKDEKDTNSQ